MLQLKSRLAIFTLVPTVLSLFALVGWALDSQWMKSVLPGLPSLNPLTATCFLALSLAVFLAQKKERRSTTNVVLLSFAVLALSGWVLVAWIWDLSLRPDAFLFASKLRDGTDTNRMVPSTALALAFFSLSLMFSCAAAVTCRRLAQGLGIASGLIGLVSFLAYAFSLGDFASLGNAGPMAITAAFSFICLTVALFTALPEIAIRHPFSGTNAEATFSRRLLLASLIVPIIIAVVEVHGERLEMLHGPLGEAAAALITVGLFVLVVWRAAEALSKSGDARDTLVATLEVRAKELLEARLEADRANQAKSHFLSRMSHELRTPMNAVIGYAQLLQMRSDDPKTHESTEAILKGGRHLLSLINEVLDLARIESGKLELSVEAVPLASVITNAIEFIQPLAEDRGINIEFVFDLDNETHVVADRQRLLQILINLLTNAAKYNRRNGRISIHCAGTPDLCRIGITDTGRGISGEDLPRLFVPFERLGDEALEGTGLGLALSQSLANMMGGRVTLEQTSPEGSTFSLELKGTPPPQAQLKAEPIPIPSGIKSNLKIVYIEDNLSNLKLMERIFEGMEGVDLATAMLGKVGEEMVINNQPDVVLLDLHLPDGGGYEVMGRLQTNPVTADIPVIVISADATDSQIKRLLNAGAKSYLTKPIDLARLFEVLREIKPKMRSAA